MPSKGTRTNLLPVAVLLGGLAVIYVFDLVTHQDVISAVATIVICGVVIVRWIWRARYS
jgi:Flp pilus assembly protein TadB